MTELQGVMERAITRARNAPMPFPEGSTVANAVTSLYDRLRRHAREHHEAGETNRLTAEAIREDRARIRQEAEAEASGLIQSATARIEAWRKSLQSQIEPADTPSEERLANARADARMILDGLDNDQVFSTLQALAVEGDAAVRHLILFTPWVTYYAKSRSMPSLADRWDTAKRQLMPELLTETGMRAYQSLDAAEDLAEVPARMRNAFTWYFKDYHRDGVPHDRKVVL